MPERVADAIDEIAGTNRGDQQEQPQIHAEPRLAATSTDPQYPGVGGGGDRPCRRAARVCGSSRLSAVSERPGLSIAGRLPVRVRAAAVVGIIAGSLLAWAFRPAQTLRRTAHTWGTTARRRTPRIPLFGSLTEAVVIGVGLAALATWIISGAVFTHAARPGDVDVVRAALPAIAGAVIAFALVVVYRRQNDTERAQLAQRFESASTQLGDSDTAVRIAGVYAMAAAADESAVFARRQQCIDVLCG
jgi:hypothetical protein